MAEPRDSDPEDADHDGPEHDDVEHDDDSCETNVRTEELTKIVRMLSHSADVRDDLVADIREQVDSGAYVNEQKLDLAIYKMLKDILK